MRGAYFGDQLPTNTDEVSHMTGHLSNPWFDEFRHLCYVDLFDEESSRWVSARMMSNVDSFGYLYLNKGECEVLTNQSNVVPWGTYVYRNGTQPKRGQYGEVFFDGEWCYCLVDDAEPSKLQLLILDRPDHPRVRLPYPWAGLFQEYGTTALPGYMGSIEPCPPPNIQKIMASILSVRGAQRVGNALNVSFGKVIRELLLYQVGDIILFGPQQSMGIVLATRRHQILIFYVLDMGLYSQFHEWISADSVHVKRI